VIACIEDPAAVKRILDHRKTAANRRNLRFIRSAHRRPTPNWIDLDYCSTARKRCRMSHRAAALVPIGDEP
jgi:hypothetical protein